MITFSEYDVCQDCYSVAMHGDDLSGMARELGDDFDEVLAECRAGLDRLEEGRGHWSDDPDEYNEFSALDCECCRIHRLAGSRYRLVWVRMDAPDPPQRFGPVLARPVRSLRHALRYWWPKRLTTKHNPRIHAWLWWNF